MKNILITFTIIVVLLIVSSLYKPNKKEPQMMFSSTEVNQSNMRSYNTPQSINGEYVVFPDFFIGQKGEGESRTSGEEVVKNFLFSIADREMKTQIEMTWYGGEKSSASLPFYINNKAFLLYRIGTEDGRLLGADEVLIKDITVEKSKQIGADVAKVIQAVSSTFQKNEDKMQNMRFVTKIYLKDKIGGEIAVLTNKPHTTDAQIIYYIDPKNFSIIGTEIVGGA